MIYSINGIYKGEGQPAIEAKAVFETMRTYGGKIFRLEDHLKRLGESARGHQIDSKWTMRKIQVAVNDILEKVNWSNESESKVKIVLTADEMCIMAEALEEKPNEMYVNGIKAIKFDGGRDNPIIKKTDDPISIEAKRLATEAGVYEAIMVDEKGYVGECAYANLFWIVEGQLFTVDEDVLKGITRQTVIEIAQANNIPFQFSKIKYEDLLKADEIFITQTTSGILPLVEVGGQFIGNRRPGPKTKELIAEFIKLVGQNIEKAQ